MTEAIRKKLSKKTTLDAINPAQMFSMKKKPIPIGKAIKKAVKADNCLGEKFFVDNITSCEKSKILLVKVIENARRFISRLTRK